MSRQPNPALRALVLTGLDGQEVLSAAIVEHLWEQGAEDAALRAYIAASASLPPTLRRLAACDPSARVKKAFLARSDVTDEEFAVALAGEQRVSVLTCVASLRHAPPAVLEQLSQRPEVVLAQELLENPNIAPGVRRRAMITAASAGRLPPGLTDAEFLESDVEGWPAYLAHGNFYMVEAVLKAGEQAHEDLVVLASRLAALGKYSLRQVVRLCTLLLTHQRIDEAILAQMQEALRALGLARSRADEPAASREAQRVLTARPSLIAQLEQARSSTDPDALAALLEACEDPAVADRVAANPHSDPETTVAALVKGSGERTEVFRARGKDQAVAAALVRFFGAKALPEHPNDEVRRALAARLAEERSAAAELSIVAARDSLDDALVATLPASILSDLRPNEAAGSELAAPRRIVAAICSQLDRSAFEVFEKIALDFSGTIGELIATCRRLTG